VAAELAVIVTARNEADRLPDTLAALETAFPGARVVVADDASTDGTAHAALQAGAALVRSPRRLGKGGAATLAARLVLDADEPPTIVLCDGDLGASAGALSGLVDAVGRDGVDLAVASFARREGGGFGVAVGFARYAVRRLTRLDMAAPISGQRVLSPQVLPAVVPFADGFGMEIGMTIDAHRAGFGIEEIELDLEHRATGRTVAGFRHRGRQLLDFLRVYISRR
jgi:glycosyltransferase involved in cell wall biosynthesis